jgi:hypothetical protein
VRVVSVSQDSQSVHVDEVPIELGAVEPCDCIRVSGTRFGEAYGVTLRM